MSGSSGNTIGGTTPAARNVISVSQAGVSILIGSSENVVAGNFIGTNAAGTAAPGNTSNGGVVAPTAPAPRPMSSANAPACRPSWNNSERKS